MQPEQKKDTDAKIGLGLTTIEFLFYGFWAGAFWIVGAIFLLTGIIPSGAPVILLAVVAGGAVIHVLSAHEFWGHTKRYGTFRRTLSLPGKAMWRGLVAGLFDIGITAGLFIAYPSLSLPDSWAVAILLGILLAPPYIVLFSLILWFNSLEKSV